VTTPPYTWKWGGNIGTKNLTVKAFDEAGLYGSMSRNVLIISLFKPRESIETAPEAVATDL